MMNPLRVNVAAGVVAAVLWMGGLATAAGLTQPEAIRHKDQWTKTHLLEPQAKMPFSFVYGDQPSEKLLADWPRKQERKKLDAARTQHSLAWTDPKTALEVRCVAVEYADFPAIEWTVSFKNTGNQNTPILDGVEGLDARFQRAGGGEFVLHGIKGDWCTRDSFAPYQITLGPGVVKKRSPAASGKSCDGPDGWPYYNVQMPGGGVMLAIGWPGHWRSLFERDAGNTLRIRAGQERTHLVLKPGEGIRTPLVALLFWRGTDAVPAQNLWRRWYVAHNMPRVKGRTQSPIAQIQVGGGAQDIAYVQSFLDAGVKPDICWRDAGAGGTTWYPSAGGPYEGKDAWLNTGTWEIDATKYPQGFKPFSDWVHAHGMKFVLWFEPERVGDPDSWLGKHHPEWLLPGTSHGSLLNLGHPAALGWLIDHVDGMVKSQGIDWYREDMNGFGPLPAWRKNDAADRQGITENLYVQGHLAFWDELRRRNPELRIDSCASGGRRNDLESMRRAVPLLRSDFQFPNMQGVVEGNQGHTYGLSFWLPFQGTGCYLYDTYAVRSFYLPSFGMGRLTAENTRAQKRAYAECAKIAPCMLGDYCPLTPYSLQPDHWIAWQFHRPEQGDGVVQAFRRDQSAESTKTLRLRGLDPSAQYELTNFDVEGTSRSSGTDLMDKGLVVEIKGKPGAAVIAYRRLGQEGSLAIPRIDNGDIPPLSGAPQRKKREVSRESVEYLKKLRKNTPFGTAGFDLKALRAGMGSRREPTIQGVKFIRGRIGEIPCEWVLAPGATPDLRLLYLHGGGFVSGSGGFYLTLAAHLSAAAKCAVILPDYRLAPEHRFPAGLEDCICAHQWMIANGPFGPAPAQATFIAGDSAGGSLTLATLLALRDRRRPLPAGGIALSPSTDLTLASESVQTVNVPIISARTMPVFRELYLGKTDPRNPLASPVFGDYRGIPPLLIQVGEHELLRDDSVRVAKKARSDGIPVKLEVWPGMFHVFQSHEPLLPEGQEAIDHIAAFMRSSLPRQ